MRTVVPSAPLILALALGGGSDLPAQETARARAAVSETEHDFGAVAVGESASFRFGVRNEGSAPLTLAAPVADKGLKASWDPAGPLAPGKSAALVVTVDTLEAIGPSRLAVTAETNDPEAPRIYVAVVVDVRHILLGRPGYARYNYVQKAREGTIVQTIGSADGADFRVTGVDSPFPYLRVAWREAKPAERRPEWQGRQWLVESTLLSDAPVGPLNGEIVVHASHPLQHRAFVPVNGFVRPIFAVTPPEARLGMLAPDRPAPLRLFVKNFAEETIELTGASTDVGGIRAEIEPLTAGRTWNISLQPMPGAAPGPFSGKLVLRTASPKVPTIAVPLSGELLPAR